MTQLFFDVTFLNLPSDPYELFVMIMYAIGIIASFTLPWLPIVLWKWRVPKPARTLVAAHRQNKAPILVVHDSGRSEIDFVEERRGSGVVITSKSKYKLLPRYTQRKSKNRKEETTPSEASEEETEGENLSDRNPNGETDEIGKRFIRSYSDWINKRSYLLGLNTPFFVAYSGLLCLLNPDALALYEAAKLKVRTEEGIQFNPNRLADRKMRDALEPLMLLEPRETKEIIESGFDETQIAAIVTDSELIGMEGRGLGKYKPLILIFIIIFFAALGIFLLPQLMGQG